jgi:hypothetical protein
MIEIPSGGGFALRAEFFETKLQLKGTNA